MTSARLPIFTMLPNVEKRKSLNDLFYALVLKDMGERDRHLKPARTFPIT